MENFKEILCFEWSIAEMLFEKALFAGIALEFAHL